MTPELMLKSLEVGNNGLPPFKSTYYSDFKHFTRLFNEVSFFSFILQLISHFTIFLTEQNTPKIKASSFNF